MGKTYRFFRALFGFKPPDQSDLHNKQTKRRWTFFKSHHHISDDPSLHHSSDQTPGADHTLPVAPTAPADAAEEVVVRMRTRTTLVGEDKGFSGESAVVKIQACFRGFLVIVFS